MRIQVGALCQRCRPAHVARMAAGDFETIRRGLWITFCPSKQSVRLSARLNMPPCIELWKCTLASALQRVHMYVSQEVMRTAGSIYALGALRSAQIGLHRQWRVNQRKDARAAIAAERPGPLTKSFLTSKPQRLTAAHTACCWLSTLGGLVGTLNKRCFSIHAAGGER